MLKPGACQSFNMLPVAVIVVIAILAFLLLVTSAILAYKLRPGRRRDSIDEKPHKESRIPAVRRLVVRYGKVVTAPPSPAPHGSRMSRWPLSLSSSRRVSVTGGMQAEDYYGEETKSLKPRDLEAQDEPYGNILYSIDEHPALPYDPQTFWKSSRKKGKYSKSARIGTDSLIESSWKTYNAHRMSDDDLSSTMGPIAAGKNQEFLITVSNPSPPEASVPPPTRELTPGKSDADSSESDLNEPVVPSAKAIGKRPVHSRKGSIDYNAIAAASVAAAPVSAFEPHSETVLPSRADTLSHGAPSATLPTLDEHAPLDVTSRQPPSVVVSKPAIHELDAQASQRPTSASFPLSPTVNSISELDHIPFYMDTSDSASISTSTSQRTPRPTSRPHSRSSNRSRSASRSNSSNSKSRNRVAKRPPPITTTLIPYALTSRSQPSGDPTDNEQTIQVTLTNSVPTSDGAEVIHHSTNSGTLPSIPTSKFSPGLLSPDLGAANSHHNTQPSRSNTVHTFASSEYNTTPLIAPVERMPIYSEFAQKIHLRAQNSAKQKALGLRKANSESRSTQRTRESQTKDHESIVQPAALPTVRIEQPGWPPRGIRPLTMQALDYDQIMSPTTSSPPNRTMPASPSHIITQFQPLGPVSRFQIRPLGESSPNFPRRSRSRYSHLFDKPLPTPPPLSTPDSQEAEESLRQQSQSSSQLPNKPVTPPNPNPTAFPNFSRTRKLSITAPPPPRTPARTHTHPLPRPLSTYQRSYNSPGAPGAPGSSSKQVPNGHKGRTRSVSEVSALSHAPTRARGMSIVSAISPLKTGKVLTRTTGVNGEWDDWRDSGVSPIESEFPTRSTRSNWS